jgi:glycosyltransferase involved in cell wall biosynthesis
MKGISVIIPVFNQEKFIAQAIESVLNQNYMGRIEVIISDDGSSDRSIEIAESYLPNVNIIRKSPGCTTQGVSGARNRGLLVATQEYICFLDSDDFYLPDHLSKISSVLENNSGLGFAFCRMLELQEIENKLKYREWTQRVITKNDILNPVLTRYRVVSTNTFIFKREVFLVAGLFNENYSNGEDSDLWMRISELYKGDFSNHFGAVYRTNHSESQLTKNNNDTLRSCEIEIYSDALKRYYLLNLKNPYRLFKIKQTLLYLKKSNSRLDYYVNYLLLIVKYPYQSIKDRYDLYLQNKLILQNKSWNDFQNLTNMNP